MGKYQMRGDDLMEIVIEGHTNTWENGMAFEQEVVLISN